MPSHSTLADITTSLLRHHFRMYLPAAIALVTFVLTGAIAKADLVTHYDVTTITPVANGTPIVTLADLSGNGNNAGKSSTAASVGTYVNSGIGGKAAIQFVSDGTSASGGSGNGYQSVLNGWSFGLTGDASYTQVFVFRSPGNTSNVYSWVGSIGNGISQHGSSIVELDGHRLDIAGGSGNDVNLNPSNSFNQLANKDLIIAVVHTGGTGNSISSTTQVYVDGYAPGQGILSGLSLGTTGDAGTAALNLLNAPFVLGGGPVGTGSGFDGLISEAFFYNSALTTAERNSLESSLGQKYSIAVAVPEPSSLVLCGAASLGFIVYYHRRRKLLQFAASHP